jgi:hypothetical protein
MTRIGQPLSINIIGNIIQQYIDENLDGTPSSAIFLSDLKQYESLPDYKQMAYNIEHGQGKYKEHLRWLRRWYVMWKLTHD